MMTVTSPFRIIETSSSIVELGYMGIVVTGSSSRRNMDTLGIGYYHRWMRRVLMPYMSALNLDSDHSSFSGTFDDI